MRDAPEHGHEAVMAQEVLGFLEPEPGEVVMDCTVGRGGHAVKIAERLSAAGGGGGRLIALDVDPENLRYARARLVEAGARNVEVRTFHANFAEARDVLEELGITGVNGLLADLGVSTNQLLAGGHGLSFNTAEPLDMRLDPRIGKKASDLVAELDERKLAEIFFVYAQERFARRIARKIVQTRATEPILTTEQLARLVRSVVPASPGSGARKAVIDPATRTFQALRMAVNLELESLEDLLATVPEMLLPGARAVFISFHSGEDRLVKRAVRDWQTRGWCEVLTKKPAEPTPEEINRSPRSRSAKLRAVKWAKEPGAA